MKDPLFDEVMRKAAEHQIGTARTPPTELVVGMAIVTIEERLKALEDRIISLELGVRP